MNAVNYGDVSHHEMRQHTLFAGSSGSTPSFLHARMIAWAESMRFLYLWVEREGKL